MSLEAERLTLNRWEAERAAMLATLWEWCGEFPPCGDLAVEEVWRREYASHTEIKLTYDGEPGERIPAYLLIPRGPSRPLPAVFAAHQCARRCDIGKEQVVGKCVDWPDQAYGLELVREGFIVLAPDANKVGERYDPALRQPWEQAWPDVLPDGKRSQDRCCTAPGGSWGPIRWKPVYDVMRGIDLLCQHERVDTARIGMIGHSLGADTTLWTMPLEGRIRAAAMSGGGLVDLPFNPYYLPYGDILRVIAPRPFFEVTGVVDNVNCGSDDTALTADQRMTKKRAAHVSAREVYALYGAADALGVLEHDGGHCFPTEGRRAAYDWLKRWLMPTGA
jgi:dienelactone hydrolase